MNKHAKINHLLIAGQQLFIEEFMYQYDVIFVDIDGVLNHGGKVHSNKWTIEQYSKWRLDNRDKWGSPFDEDSMYWMNKAIDELDLKIVISSTWRTNTEDMQNLWKSRGMSGEVIGVTGYDRSRIRGKEIETWLDNRKFTQWNWDWTQAGGYYNNHKSLIRNYVIVDDDSDMLYTQRHNFVKCDGMIGFGENEYESCKTIISNPLRKTMTNYKEIKNNF